MEVTCDAILSFENLKLTQVRGYGSLRRGHEQATRAQLLRFTQPMDYECVAGLVSAEGSALSAVKPWSSFQCTGIHHAVRARTYKGDEHLTYALNKSTAPLSLPFFTGDRRVKGGIESYPLACTPQHRCITGAGLL